MLEIQEKDFLVHGGSIMTRNEHEFMSSMLYKISYLEYVKGFKKKQIPSVKCCANLFNIMYTSNKFCFLIFEVNCLGNEFARVQKIIKN